MAARILIIVLFFLNAPELGAQDGEGEREFYRKVGAHLNVGSIFAHAEDVENTAGSVPYGFELEISKRKIGESAWNTCHCYPTTGFLIGYTNYDNIVLGHGFHAAYFLEHTFLPFKWWSPVLRGTAGLSASNRPHDSEKNPDNQSYSLPINAFLQLQLGFNFRIAESGLLSIKAGYNHISNGGIQEPNKGINWPHLTAGYLHFLDYHQPPRREKQDLTNKENRWIKRFELFGAYTTREFEEKESFFAYGAMATLSRKFSALHGLSLAGEWHYHEEQRRRIEYNDDEASAHRAAVLIGHDFLFGQVVFSQQLGVYVFDEYNYHDPVYHRWTISYVFGNGLSVGTSVKAHRHVAEFLDVRLGFQW